MNDNSESERTVGQQTTSAIVRAEWRPIKTLNGPATTANVNGFEVDVYRTPGSYSRGFSIQDIDNEYVCEAFLDCNDDGLAQACALAVVATLIGGKPNG